MKIERSVWSVVFVSLLLSAFLLPGCAPVANDFQSKPVEIARNKGRISFFLNLRDKDGPDLSIQISSLELTAENGSQVIHNLAPLTVDSDHVEQAGQIFLTRMAVDQGKYIRIRLIVDEASYVREDGKELIPLKVSEAVMELRTPLDIRVGDSKSLFFTWDTKQSLLDKQFYPSITVAPTLKKLISDVAYVACPEIDTVFMVSTEQNRVIDSVGIPGGPTYLFNDKDPRSEEVYVLAGKALQLDAFSPTTNRITEKYDLTTLSDPVHVAFNGNGRWGYVLDKQLGTVSRMDMTSGTIDRVVNLNFPPVYILYLEEYNLIAVSLSIAQTVVLINGDTMEEAGSIKTGAGPEGLAFIEGRLLYIAETGANSVMIYDLQGNSLFKRISVGFQPRRILQTENYVYVSNYGNNSISTLRYGGLTISRNISFAGKPLEMAYVEKFNQIYIGNSQTMSLVVLNSLDNDVKGNVELGAVPQGIVVLKDQGAF